MQKKFSNLYFFLSFVPALGYWILESYYSLTVALVGGVLLGISEIIIERFFSGKVHSISKLNLGLVVFLGLISLWAQEGIWFKLQPTFTGIILFFFLGYQKLQKKSFMVEMMKDFNQSLLLPNELYQKLEWHLALFVLTFGIFMAYIAFSQSTDVWIFWKTIGFYLAFFVFIIVEFVFLRMKLRTKR